MARYASAVMFRSPESAPGASLPRPMRKGTRSCAECRRRKIRCVFRTSEHLICKHCEAHGIVCVEQRKGPLRTIKAKGQPDLQERVARLEALLQSSLAHDGDADHHGSLQSQTHNYPAGTAASSEKIVETPSTTSPLEAQSSPASLESISDNFDPIATLFDNGIWQRSSRDNGPYDEGSLSGGVTGFASQKHLTKHARARAALLADLPTPDLLSKVLSATGSWWRTWGPLGSCSAYIISESLHSFVARTLCSESLPLIGLALLCIAVSIEQLDPCKHSHLIQQLEGSQGELFQKYFDRVLRIIVNDSDYAVSIEGIEVTMMCSKLMMNLGIIRSCWMLCRKAITCSQLLGIHRPQRPLPTTEPIRAKSREHFWISLCHQDAYLSLVLGLPYGFYEKAIPSTVQAHDADSRFRHEMLKLSIQAIDRSQMGLSHSPEIAKEIQKELELAAATMPREFWNSSRDVASRALGEESYLETVAAQFWYHQIRVSVHMPLMIQSIQNHKLENHRKACLEASRDLLDVYHIMRSDRNSAFKMISIIDYQAFIASALLILGMLGYGSSLPIPGAVNQSADEKLIRSTVETLRESAKAASTSSTASQALQGLETLSFLLNGKACSYVGKGPGKAKPHIKVIVPYSGTITISPGHLLDHQNCSPQAPEEHPPPTFTFLDYDQIQQPSKDVTAGLGDIHFNQAMSFDGHTQPEYAPIDFDWNSIMGTNLDGSWAWLSDINTTM